MECGELMCLDSRSVLESRDECVLCVWRLAEFVREVRLELLWSM